MTGVARITTDSLGKVARTVTATSGAPPITSVTSPDNALAKRTSRVVVATGE